MIATRNCSHPAEHGDSSGCWTKALVNTLHGKLITGSWKIYFPIFISKTATRRSWITFPVRAVQSSQISGFDGSLCSVPHIWQKLSTGGAEVSDCLQVKIFRGYLQLPIKVAFTSWSRFYTILPPQHASVPTPLGDDRYRIFIYSRILKR